MIYLIIPLHNEGEHLKTFTECLNAQTASRFIVWIDSGEDGKDLHEIQKCRFSHVWLHVSKHNYWSGMIRHGQKWIQTEMIRRRITGADIVGIMNTDETFAPDFIEKMCAHVKARTIVATIEDGIRINWHDIWTRKNGAISTIQAWEPNALGNRAVFMRASDFSQIKLHPHILPHYCSDYDWTYRAIKKGLKTFIPLDCKLNVDYARTGITKPKTLRELFSVRCPHNPIFYTVLIILCCPWKYKIQNIIRVWGYAAVRIMRLGFIKQGEDTKCT